MKKIFFLIALSTIFFYGCQIIEAPPEEVTTPTSSNAIMAKVTGGVLSGDTLYTEQGLVVHLSAFSSGPAITRWQWLIYGSVYEGQTIKYVFTAVPPASTTVTLKGTDNNNTVHQKSIVVVLKGTLDGLRDVQWISSSNAGSGDFNVVIAFKNKMQYISTNNWNTWEPPTWAPTAIPVSDISFDIENGNLVSVPDGQGKYVVVRRKLSPGDNYKIAVGKIDQQGQSIWGTYDGETVVEYDVLPNGTVVFNNENPSTYPGSTGDVGGNPVVRWEFLADRALLYINNKVPTSGNSPFIRYINGADTSAPISGTAVTGFPNWSMYTVMYSSLEETEGLIEWFAGLNSNAPKSPLSFLNESSYFNDDLARLRALLAQVGVGGDKKWEARSMAGSIK